MHPRRPVLSPALRRLLMVVFALFGLLTVNGVYLGSVTLLEWWTGGVHQDYLYALMFLVHLLLGLLLLVPAVVFGAGHLRRAWRRPNRAAVRAGLALYGTALALLLSGLLLTRFDFFTVRDPVVREGAYWLHVVAPLVVVWLFVLHRLAGAPIRWRVGVAWAAGAVALTLVLVGLETPSPGAGSVDRASYLGDAFRPALAKTADGGLIPARALMMDGYCQECHADVHRQWSHSAHRFSSFNNPAYRFSVRETRRVALGRGDSRAARFCAGCHDPVPLFSGAFDNPDYDDRHDPTASAGITCTVCHAIERVDSRRGNADFTLAAPHHYPFAFSDNPVLAWVNRQLIKAKPEFHKKTFLKPLHQRPEFCGACHKVSLPKAINGYKWLRGQDHFDSFRLSGVSGHGVNSFYYPERAVETCARCHMPVGPSDDFGARDFSGAGFLGVHDHQFPAANTALAHWKDLPPEVNARHRAQLRDALRIDLFGLKRGGDIDGELLAPLGDGQGPMALEPGQRYLLELVLRTLKPGHAFTQGTSDSNQVWLELVARADGRVIGRSGGQDDDGRVDPWAHFVNAYVLDRQGQRIDRRNGQDIFTTLYNHQIPPGAADVAHYGFRVPAGVQGPVEIQARLRYRKFDTRYLRYIQDDPQARNDLPVVTIAEARVELPVGRPTVPESSNVAIPLWQRWNDYGIALLRKGGRGELRQAEAAFRRVEALGWGTGAVNLARVALREGRLDQAAAALQRALQAKVPAWPWVVTWLTARVDEQNGHLDAAIAGLRRLVASDFAEARRRGFDFSQDSRLVRELGQALVERSKRERGPSRQARRESLLKEAASWFQRALGLDPEDAAAHYALSRIQRWLGEPQSAEHHLALYRKYRPDDNARDRVVAEHRARHPAADHAAGSVVIYDLQRPGAFDVDADRETGRIAVGDDEEISDGG